jgi:trehalose utilization protein
MGTDCSLNWRDVGERERLWVTSPGHPITDGIDSSIEVPVAEMYGEYFDIPDPDQLVFVSWFEGGEVFRSGCCYERGKGRIFYFRPGHEEYPIYYQEEIQDVLANGIRWAAPREGSPREFGNVDDPPEEIE